MPWAGYSGVTASNSKFHVVPEGDEGSTVPHLRCKAERVSKNSERSKMRVTNASKHTWSQ